MNPLLAIKALQLRKWLNEHELKPVKIYETDKEVDGLYVYHFQAGFRTKEDREMFKLLARLFNESFLEVLK